MITIETINGKQMTVVWHDLPLGGDFRLWQDAIVNLMREDDISKDGVIHHYTHKRHITTALPALPKHPKPEDALLLYRYMAEGVDPVLISNHPILKGSELFWEKWIREGWKDCTHDPEITNASFKGKEIEVAIKENNNE